LNNFASCSRRSERALQSLQLIPQYATNSASEKADGLPGFLLSNFIFLPYFMMTQAA